jgi:hypothetical protein
MTDISRFKPKTVYVAYIAATPEKVWQALIDPAFSRQYFFGFAVEVEPRIGGRFRMLWPDGRVHVVGEVAEWSPPCRLAVTWLVEGMKDFGELPGCLVTYDIAPSGLGGEAHHVGIAFLGCAARYPQRRRDGLAENPLEPENPSGNRQAAGDGK